MYGLPDSSFITNYKLTSYSIDDSIFPFVNIPTQRVHSQFGSDFHSLGKSCYATTQHSDDLVDAVKRDHRHLDDEAAQREMQ